MCVCVCVCVCVQVHSDLNLDAWDANISMHDSDVYQQENA